MNTKTLSTVSLASGSAHAQFHPQSQKPQGARSAGQRQGRQQKPACVCYSAPEEQPCEKNELGMGRRASMCSSAAALAAVLLANPSFPAQASESAVLTSYTDAVDKWTMDIPEGWELGVGSATGSAAERRVVAFFPKGSDGSFNVTVVCTNVGSDFTKMGSFGNPFEFGTRLVGSLDRSSEGKKPKFMGGDGRTGDGTGQIAKLINTSPAKDFYTVEYTIEKPNVYNRHLFQVVGLAFNGMYNRLYTVTGQVPEDRVDEVRKTIGTILDSFKVPQ